MPIVSIPEESFSYYLIAFDFFKGLTKVIHAGTAYMEHVQFVEKAQQTQPRQVGTLLAQYVQGLSEASLKGFKEFDR